MEGIARRRSARLQRDGEPLPSIDVVIVTANRNLSKLCYIKPYVEGSDDPPDCSSANGVTPDAGIRAPQSSSCATCQHNVWGSRITEDGKKLKACGDTRRLALIPERDLECKSWGAPLLLRIPPGTFQALAEYARTALGGKEYCAVITRIGFDMNVAYPKMTFRPLRWVTEAEAAIVAGWRNNDIVKRIIGTDADPSAPNVRVTAMPSTLRPAVVVQAQPPGAADLTRATLAAAGHPLCARANHLKFWAGPGGALMCSKEIPGITQDQRARRPRSGTADGTSLGRRYRRKQ